MKNAFLPLFGRDIFIGPYKPVKFRLLIAMRINPAITVINIHIPARSILVRQRLHTISLSPCSKSYRYVPNPDKPEPKSSLAKAQSSPRKTMKRYLHETQSSGFYSKRFFERQFNHFFCCIINIFSRLFSALLSSGFINNAFRKWAIAPSILPLRKRAIARLLCASAKSGCIRRTCK